MCILVVGGLGRIWYIWIVYVGVRRCVVYGRWGVFCFFFFCDILFVFVSDFIVCMILYIYICLLEFFNFIFMILL